MSLKHIEGALFLLQETIPNFISTLNFYQCISYWANLCPINVLLNSIVVITSTFVRCDYVHDRFLENTFVQEKLRKRLER